MKNLFLVTVFLFSAALQANQVDKIIGDNDLVVVNKEATNVPFKFKNVINAFGVIKYQDTDSAGNPSETYYGCTATHIGRGYVLTAGHCVGANSQLKVGQGCSFSVTDPFFGNYNSSITAIEWGYRQGVEPYMKSTCQEVVVALTNNEGFDFAILKVSPSPDEFIAPDTSRRAIIGDSVTIFSHPNGEVLQWSRTCGVERVLHPEIPGSYVQHKCDTNPGSSGATIINMVSMKVVGIHDGGLNDMTDSGQRLTTGMNYGTYIYNSPVLDWLLKLGF